jgi:hypothetical protein
MAKPITVDLIDEMIDICFPKGKTTPWEVGLNRVPEPEYKALIKAVVFGEPDTITRSADGEDFVATGKVEATMKHYGFTAHSATEVRFKYKKVGKALTIKKLSGIKVKMPVLPIWTKPKAVDVTMEGNDVFVFTTPAGFSLKLNLDGKLVWF